MTIIIGVIYANLWILLVIPLYGALCHHGCHLRPINCPKRTGLRTAPAPTDPPCASIPAP